MMVFERREVEGVDFSTSYRFSVLAVGKCEVILGERIEKMKKKVIGNSAMRAWRDRRLGEK